MRQLSPIEREKAKLLKLARTLIRAKHAAAADDELNQVLPELEIAIDTAIQSGKSFDMGKKLEALLGGE
jgi:hypothetical protein